MQFKRNSPWFMIRSQQDTSCRHPCYPGARFKIMSSKVLIHWQQFVLIFGPNRHQCQDQGPEAAHTFSIQCNIFIVFSAMATVVLVSHISICKLFTIDSAAQFHNLTLLGNK